MFTVIIMRENKAKESKTLIIICVKKAHMKNTLE